jgi:outer membrane protein TolC
MTLEELAAAGKADRVKMFAGQEPITRPLTLDEVIARAIKYNLDKRVKMMEEALALNQTKLDSYDLLPKLVGNAGYSYSTTNAATRSTDAVTQQPALANPYYSTDQNIARADLGLTWNILDFGVSWYNAKQNADRVLIAAERRRKVLFSLVQEARGVYWRAVGAQSIHDRASKALVDAEQVLKESKNVREEELRSPLDELRFEKTLLENMRLLRLVEAEVAAAHAELGALINADPLTPFEVAVPTSDTMKIPEWNMSSERMQELAFTSNPDLREQLYQSRITVDETKKTMLRLLPGISFSITPSYNSNSFLVNNTWTAVGAQLSWNLLNILSGPSQIRMAEASKSLAEQRVLALRMATLAHVEIANRLFVNSEQQFALADKLFAIDKAIAESVVAREEKSTQGRGEEVATTTIFIGSELRRYATYAAMHVALGRVYSSIGLDLMPENVSGTDVDTLSRDIGTRLAILDSGAVDSLLPSQRAAAPSSQ